jgi:hypothetical protein
MREIDTEKAGHSNLKGLAKQYQLAGWSSVEEAGSEKESGASDH